MQMPFPPVSRDSLCVPDFTRRFNYRALTPGNHMCLVELFKEQIDELYPFVYTTILTHT
nr:MAG TPA: hypothetical protein [Caudoviricetes sp.]